uniref:C-type lectin domain-containing protein n=1 Tax=Amphiprion ocellaris TaxID=80972 RepID=A0A3Q1CGI7_AMPOC
MGLFSYQLKRLSGSVLTDNSLLLYQFFLMFMAETAESEKTYVLIRYLRTWNDAQTYCRQHYKDLPIIESAEDNANVQAVKPLVDAWIGLYREAWTWSNNQSSSFRNWQFREPDNAFLNEYCVAEDYQHNWRDTDCQRKIAFICHKGDHYQTENFLLCSN